MYTLFTNEKLGMLVEGMRLADIRQQIDGGMKAWKEAGAPVNAYEPYDTMQ